MAATFWRNLLNKSLLINWVLLVTTGLYSWLLQVILIQFITLTDLISFNATTGSNKWLQQITYTYKVHSIFHLPHGFAIQCPENGSNFLAHSA